MEESKVYDWEVKISQLKQRCESKEITQLKLAQLIAVNKNTINRLFKYKNIPSLKLYLSILEVIDNYDMLCIETQIDLKNIMNNHSYSKVELDFGKSFMYNADFYKTEIDKIYITNYNMMADEPLCDNTCFAFNKITGKGRVLTLELIDSIGRHKLVSQILNKLL